EIRDRFDLTRVQCSTVSGFLRRLQQGTFVKFPYIVQKIERVSAGTPRKMRVSRYLLKLRVCSTTRHRRTRLQNTTIGEPVPGARTGNREHPV
ncbi:MAG TPA: hypothetical protein VMV55_03210, partial [Methanoregula sp.]|nr:hypothetical protein [Methanoregula sp.]